MDKGRIGILVPQPSPAETLASIERAEDLGVSAVWLTTGFGMPDALTLYAAAAVRTKTIKLGTFIVPTFPRHPLVMAQQAEVIANLAPGRLILGVGISHRSIMADTFGLPYERPLEHLREYVTVLTAALHRGAVGFDGARFRVHAQVPHPAPVPVMISSLRVNSFRITGALADGALPWLCPAPYLRDVALPAMGEGAASANRPVPPLIPGVPVVLSEDPAEAARAARKHLRLYLRMPFYVGTLVAAGFPEAQQGEWSDRMLDGLVIHGSEGTVAARLQSFLATAGADQLVASFLPTGSDGKAGLERAMRLVASL